MNDSTIDRASAGRRWYFYENASGGWQWDCVDTSGALVAKAPCPFESRTACVSDAKRHGYGADHPA